jgi:hypothetical protein
VSTSSGTVRVRQRGRWAAPALRDGRRGSPLEGARRRPGHRAGRAAHLRWSAPCLLLRFKRLGLRHDHTEATLRPLLLLVVSIINLRRLVSTTGF